MQTLLQDLRYGMRMLMKNPGFTLLAMLMLALGIGANTAIFSVVNAVLLRPLPFPDAEGLVMVWDSIPRMKLNDAPASAAEFQDWRNQSRSFESVSAFRGQVWNLTDGDRPERIEGAQVSANLFSTLGVQPILGNVFASQDETRGANPVVILGYGFWQRHFAANPHIVGEKISLNKQRYTVVGVMPQGFNFPSGTNMPSGLGFSTQVEMWEPLALSDQEAANRGNHNLAVIARLKPEVSTPQAQAEMDTISNQMQQQYPRSNTGISARLLALREQVVGDVRTALWILLGTVALVLLIACANAANLLLAIATSRKKEMAIRTALGARRSRLFRQLLSESLLLSMASGAAGLLLAVWGIDALRVFIPTNIPRANEMSLDGRILIFTLAVSILTGLLFGLAPALQATRSDFNEALKEGVKGAAAGTGHNRLRSLFVVAQVAIAVVLLIGAGLLMKSFVRLQQVNPGFDDTNVLTMEVVLPTSEPSNYTQPEQRAAFFQQALEGLNNAPGVEAAAVVSSLPLSGIWEDTNITIEGYHPPSPEQQPQADFTGISADYFRVLKIPLRQGRSFTEQDRAEAPNVMIINEALANRFYAGENPIGKRINLGFQKGWWEIVGVVGDVKQKSLNAETKIAVYFPYQQFPYPAYVVAVRSTLASASVTESVRQAIRAIDPTVPIANLRTMEQVASQSVSQRRFTMFLLSLFAALALILASIGIYGVMSYAITQRTHEIGIRMALGAKQRDVLKMMVGHGMVLTLSGIALGLITAYAVTRLMASLLFSVTATDTMTFVVVPVILTGVALAACLVPARRAAKVDPMVALRYE